MRSWLLAVVVATVCLVPLVSANNSLLVPALNVIEVRMEGQVIVSSNRLNATDLTMVAGKRMAGFSASLTGPASGIIELSQPIITADEAAVALTVDEWSQVLREIPAVQAGQSTGEPLSWRVRWRCLSVQESVVVQFQLPFSFRSVETKETGHHSFDGEFTVSCTSADVTLGRSDAGEPLPGLDVWSFPPDQEDGQADVVKDGVACAGYIPSEDLSTVRLVGSTRQYLTFWVFSRTDDVQLQPITALVEKPDVLSVAVSGDFAGGGEVQNGTYHAFSLSLECLSEGESVVTVLVSGNQVNSFFTFRKQCEGRRRPHGDKYIGLQVGWSPGHADVVHDGVAVGSYKGDGPQEALTANQVTVHVSNMLVEDDKFDVIAGETLETIEFYTNFGATEKNIHHGHMVDVTFSGLFANQGILQPDTTLPLFIQFRCLRAGVSSINIELHANPQGHVEFTLRKKCTEHDVQAAISKPHQNTIASLPGLSIGRSAHQPEDVMFDGHVADEYLLGQDSGDGGVISSLHVIGPDKLYMSFLLEYFPDDQEVESAESLYQDMWPEEEGTDASGLAAVPQLELGAVQVYESGTLMQPEVIGRAGEGGTLVRGGASLAFSVVFHCGVQSNGSDVLSVVLPWRHIRPTANAALNDRIQKLHVPPTILHVVKKCKPSSSKTPLAALGGVGVTGLSVGSTPDGSEIVRNGFPTRLYYGGLTADAEEWDAIAVPDGKSSLPLYLRLDNTTDSVIRELKVLAPSAVDMRGGVTVHFAGEAAAGTTLVRGNPEVPVILKFICLSEGTFMVTVVLEIEPHGHIQFKIPKLCGRHAAPELKGVSIAAGDTAIMQDGQLLPVYKHFLADATRLPPPGSSEHVLVSSGETTVFSVLVGTGAPTERALEPVAYCHETFCNPSVTHTFPRRGGIEGGNGDMELRPADEPYLVTVEHNCVMPGVSPITLVSQLRPHGKLEITWLVDCTESADSDTSDWRDWDLNTPREDMGDFGDEDENDDEDGEGADDLVRSDEGSGDESSDADAGETYDDFEHWRPPTVPGTGHGNFVHGSAVNIGLTPTGSEVVKRSVPQAGFKGAGTENYFMRGGRTSLKLYMWVGPTDKQTYAAPQVSVVPTRAARSHDGRPGLFVTLSGDGAKGGEVHGRFGVRNRGEAVRPTELVLSMRCRKPGIYAVFVSIPLLAPRGTVSFRLMKTCGDSMSEQSLSNDASFGRKLVYVVLGVGLLICLIRRFAPAKLWRRGYWYRPVQMMSGDEVRAAEDRDDLSDEALTIHSDNGWAAA